MSGWLSVLVPLGVAALTVTATAVVNFKLRFASDAASASKELKSIALRVSVWAANIFLLAQVLADVLSHEPITRFSAFVIALRVSVLALFAMLLTISRLLDLMPQLLHAQREHLEITRKQMEAEFAHGNVARVRGEINVEVDKTPLQESKREGEGHT